MSVKVSHLVEKMQIPASLTGKLTEAMEQLLEEHGLGGGEVGVILADDEDLRALNQKYRNKDLATDVLSFSFLEPQEAKASDNREFAVGDIYISVERAREQADEAGHSLEKEVFLLAIHGLLHLLGYDHEQEEQKRVMQQKEKQIMKRAEKQPGGG